MSIPAIPTTYSGVRFRSRLEAKWAAFFDLSAWSGEYEPLDLAGYVPDFVLRFARDLVVEVKPIMSFLPEDHGDTIRHAIGKIDQAHPDGEALIIGATVDTYFGWFRDVEAGWGAAVAFFCRECGHRSVCSEHGSWRCRMSGCDSVRAMMDCSVFDIPADFRTASNRVQWRAA